MSGQNANIWCVWERCTVMLPLPTVPTHVVPVLVLAVTGWLSGSHNQFKQNRGLLQA